MNSFKSVFGLRRKFADSSISDTFLASKSINNLLRKRSASFFTLN